MTLHLYICASYDNICRTRRRTGQHHRHPRAKVSRAGPRTLQYRGSSVSTSLGLGSSITGIWLVTSSRSVTYQRSGGGGGGGVKGQQSGAKDPAVQGFFSQYIPRPGVQYYRDLAGNIKQVSNIPKVRKGSKVSRAGPRILQYRGSSASISPGLESSYYRDLAGNIKQVSFIGFEQVS